MWYLSVFLGKWARIWMSECGFDIGLERVFQLVSWSRRMVKVVICWEAAILAHFRACLASECGGIAIPLPFHLCDVLDPTAPNMQSRG